MNTCRICWTKIGEEYTDRFLFCSSCRKEIEKEIWFDKEYLENTEDELYAWKQEYKKLKKENKNLKSDLEKYKKYYDRDKEELMESCYWLARENDRLKNNAMEDMRVQTKLEEKIRFLEECLDNKEKVNKQLREDIEMLSWNIILW